MAPPPPDDDNFWPPEARPAPVKTPEPTPTPPAVTKAASGKEKENGRPVFGETKGNGRNGHNKIIVVEIKPVGAWQQACRQSVKAATEFPGEEGLRLRLAGQNLTMDFPNQQTRVCTELIEKLERIHGVLRVYEA
ncbi:MAG: hypothetical protein IAE79_13965 [Anaerolinea sp.]|nr:hypothetical protein [Anaerolinea sp.]